MEAFSPYTALAGGLLIGSAASLLLVLNGRICGVSGIAWGLFPPAKHDGWWRVAFLMGLLIGGQIIRWLYPAAAMLVIDLPWGGILLAGLLVGYGTRLGGGCTSGHGICGVGRLSPRSLIATLCFMMAGFATVYVVRHLLAEGL